MLQPDSDSEIIFSKEKKVKSRHFIERRLEKLRKKKGNPMLPTEDVIPRILLNLQLFQRNKKLAWLLDCVVKKVSVSKTSKMTHRFSD